LEDEKVHFLKNIKQDINDLGAVIRSAGGKIVKTAKESTMILGDKDIDRATRDQVRSGQIKVYDVELILTGILQNKLVYNKYELK